MNLKIAEKINSDEVLKSVIDNFDEEICLVGGAVRDLLLGKVTYDRDLLILDNDAKIFSQKIAKFFDATFVPLDETNKIYRVVMKDKINYLDITNPIENDLEKDLKRRDLTINALVINLRNNELIDIVNGLSDLNSGILRIIEEKNLFDDPLRLLRVFRFQAVTGFKIDEESLKYIEKYIDLISRPAIERINYEIMHLYSGKYTETALKNMDEIGLLERIFPIVNDLKKVPPNSHHHLRLFEHSIETVKQINILYENSSNDVKEHLEKNDFGGYSRLAHLKLAGFLHDIGKFQTWTIDKDTGRHRFIKHDDVGAKMSVSILKKMAFSNKQIDYISTMIKKHIYPSSVISAPLVNEKIMMRYVRKMEDNSIDEIILAQADRLSARGPEISDEIIEENINALTNLLEFYLKVKDTLEPLPKLLDGNEVMKILNIPPSPKLGEIMNALHEAQINGDIMTKEHALEFVKNFN